MAKILSKSGITTGNTVEAFHVTQSVDAFTGIDAYDITISGSLTVSGSLNFNGGVTGSSFTGSFVGDGSGLTGVGGDSFPYTGSAIISGSLEVTGSVNGRLNKNSITIDNSTGIAENISGSGIYPGMIVSVDLSQSNTNIIRLALSPITEYKLGARFEFYIAESPGTSAYLRVDTDGVATYQGNFLAVGNPFATSGSTQVNNVSGAGDVGDRIVITKISEDYWALEGAVKNGNKYSAS